MRRVRVHHRGDPRSHGGTSDLTDGVFRHLVITGRSRLALYLAPILAGLSIPLPLVAVAFAMVCLVTGYEGVSQPTSVNEGGIRTFTQTVPALPACARHCFPACPMSPARPPRQPEFAPRPRQ